jgi:hypothetical protein
MVVHVVDGEIPSPVGNAGGGNPALVCVEKETSTSYINGKGPVSVNEPFM